MSTFEALPFYRGVSEKYPTDRSTIVRPRLNRRPKNSSTRFHEIADQWFKGRFGIPYRSQGVFVTSSLVSASHYAATPDHVMRIVPLSSYRYCWSPTISDLLFTATRLAASSAEVIHACLDASEYRELELEDAHAAGHEVMLHCDQYIAIPVGLIDQKPDPGQQSVILLS